MSEYTPKTDSDDGNLGEIYFKIQSELDFTKHIGALDATDEIRDLCQIGPESLVLDVGCGVGVTATYLAKTIGCHVTGIELREGMIARSNERAERDGVTDHVSFRVADATALPFEDEAFDVPQYRCLMKAAMQEPKELLRYWGDIVAVADKAAH